MKNVGNGISNVGGKLTMGLTVPIVGAGIASGKMAMDFEDSMAKVSTISDDIAYNNHDIQDGIKAKLFDLNDKISTLIRKHRNCIISKSQLSYLPSFKKYSTKNKFMNINQNNLRILK